MASVQKVGSKYVVMYRYETETGEKKQKKVSGFSTREEAWAAARDLEARSNAGIEVNGGAVTCAEIMERWFMDRAPFLAPTTSAKYSSAIDKLQATFVADLKVRRLNQSFFNQLVEVLSDHGRLSMRTVLSNTEPLRLSLSWALRQGLIPVNPMESVTLPRAPKRRQKILSDADVQDLLDASVSPLRRTRDFRLPLLLALYGGLRREECAGLRWESVDLSAGTVTVQDAVVLTPDGVEHMKDPKTAGSTRTVTLPKWVTRELSAARDVFLARSDASILRHNPQHRVCVTSTGEPYSCHSYAHALSRLISEINSQREQLKLPRMPLASFHDLRHTHAAMCIRLGIQPKVISERLGHSSIKITMDTYGYLMPGLQQSVADAFDKEYNDQHPPLRAVE